MASCVLPSGSYLRNLPRLVKLTVVDYPDVQRPRTRGECAEGGCAYERPCPWVSCRFHLAVEVTTKGNVKIDRRWEEGAMRETCALDVAERGQHTLEELAQVIGCTRERVRQIEEIAARKVRAATSAQAYDVPDAPGAYGHAEHLPRGFRL